jgi:hypothetical protein
MLGVVLMLGVFFKTPEREGRYQIATPKQAGPPE